MVEHYWSDSYITDIVHLNKKEKEKKMCYKYASGTVLVIDIFAICKYFKTDFFMSAS